MVTRIWFCISDKSLSDTTTWLPLRQSLPRLASTTTVVESDSCRPVPSIWSTSPSVREHSCPPAVRSGTSRLRADNENVGSIAAQAWRKPVIILVLHGILCRGLAPSLRAPSNPCKLPLNLIGDRLPSPRVSGRPGRQGRLSLFNNALFRASAAAASRSL